jgi:hypothetical protein
MATKQFVYKGDLDEVELPEFGVVVKRGGHVEVEGKINHPGFEEVKDKPAAPDKESK